jgi:hypothetical protein
VSLEISKDTDPNSEKLEKVDKISKEMIVYLRVVKNFLFGSETVKVSYCFKTNDYSFIYYQITFCKENIHEIIAMIFRCVTKQLENQPHFQVLQNLLLNDVLDVLRNYASNCEQAKSSLIAKIPASKKGTFKLWITNATGSDEESFLHRILEYASKPQVPKEVLVRLLKFLGGLTSCSATRTAILKVLHSIQFRKETYFLHYRARLLGIVWELYKHMPNRKNLLQRYSYSYL